MKYSLVISQIVFIVFTFFHSAPVSASLATKATLFDFESIRDSLQNRPWQDSLAQYKQGKNYLKMMDLFNKVKIEEAQDPNVWFQSALFQLEIGQIDQARSDVQEALRLDPGQEDYLGILIDIAIYKEEWKEVQKLSDQLIELKPTDPKPYSQKVFALFQQDLRDQAMETVEVMGQKLGKTPEYYIDKVRILQSNGKNNEALKSLDEWRNSDHQTPELYLILSSIYLTQGAQKKAITAIEEGLITFPSNRILTIELANQLLKQGKETEATTHYLTAFKDADLNPTIKIGVLYEFVGPASKTMKIEGMRKLLEVMEDQYSDNPAVINAIADVYLVYNDLEKAEQYYLQALSIDNQSPQVWSQLLQVYYRKQQFDKAIEIGVESNKLFPQQTRLLFFLAKAYEGKKDYVNARSYLEQALNVARDENELSAVFIDLGYVYRQLEMFDESYVAFEEALSLDPENALLLNNYAYYLSLQGKQLDKAYTMAIKSNQLDPSMPHVYDTIAWILFKQEKYEEALKWIKKAFRLTKPMSRAVLDHYGDILYHTGKVKSAVSYWEKALKLQVEEDSSNELLKKKINERTYFPE